MPITTWWKCLTPKDIVAFQLFEEILYIDFGDFHEAVEEVFNRPIFDIELVKCIDEIRAEFMDKYYET